MEHLPEIIKVSLPSLFLAIVVVLIILSYFKNEEKKRRYESIAQNRKLTVSIRLQAYERILIYLERIGLDSLLKRVSKKDMTVGELQQRLLSTIRSEFEHNFSQQLYISTEAWQRVVKTKENTIQIINTQSLKIDQKKPALHLSKAILEYMMELSSPPGKTTIEFLKKEAQLLF
jgi:hypothetical protein